MTTSAPTDLSTISYPFSHFDIIMSLMQEEHVAIQQMIDEEYKQIFHGSNYFISCDMDLNLKWFFFIILKQRFDKEELTAQEKVYIEALADWMEKHAPICNVCGIHSLGEMCRGDEPLPRQVHMYYTSYITFP